MVRAGHTVKQRMALGVSTVGRAKGGGEVEKRWEATHEGDCVARKGADGCKGPRAPAGIHPQAARAGRARANLTLRTSGRDVHNPPALQHAVESVVGELDRGVRTEYGDEYCRG